MPKSVDIEPLVIPGGLGDILITRKSDGAPVQQLLKPDQKPVIGSSGVIYVSERIEHPSHGYVDHLPAGQSVNPINVE
jgi:hypothetical protein